MSFLQQVVALLLVVGFRYQLRNSKALARGNLHAPPVPLQHRVSRFCFDPENLHTSLVHLQRGGAVVEEAGTSTSSSRHEG